ncbi:MAG: hypothetical protein Q8Q24_00285, partial [bacterium]|nr:hypothetical protein [bacterium]
RTIGLLFLFCVIAFMVGIRLFDFFYYIAGFSSEASTIFSILSGVLIVIFLFRISYKRDKEIEKQDNQSRLFEASIVEFMGKSMENLKFADENQREKVRSAMALCIYLGYLTGVRAGEVK